MKIALKKKGKIMQVQKKQQKNPETERGHFSVSNCKYL